VEGSRGPQDLCDRMDENGFRVVRGVSAIRTLTLAADARRFTQIKRTYFYPRAFAFICGYCFGY
jgi:hypothetical protein